MESRTPSEPVVAGHAPSGLFPSGPPRPTLREPHPVRLGPLCAGAALAAAWLLVFGMLTTTVAGYVWVTVAASLVASVCAAVLTVFGDRGAAVGVAISTGLGLAIAAGVVVERWVTSGWPLW